MPSLVLVVLLVGACGSSESTASPTRSVVATDAASPSVSAASSEAASPASPATSPTPAQPWQTYRSGRFHYSLKYPPGWVVTPGSAKLPDAFDDFQHFVYASRTKVTGTVSLKLTIAFETKYMKSHYRAKLLTSKGLTAGGWPARLLTFNATRDGRKFYVQELIAAKGSAAYFLVWWSDQGNATADKTLFRRIFTTFRRI